MTQRTLDRIGSYLEAKEGFTVLSVAKTPYSEAATVIDCFGFIYRLELTLTGRVQNEMDSAQIPLKSEFDSSDEFNNKQGA